MSAHAAAVALDVRCALGEGVVWDERRAALFWVDIPAGRLWMHRPERDRGRSWGVPGPLGCLALCDDGRLLIGLAKGLYLAMPDETEGSALALQPLAAVETELAHTRINDGRCDRDGNFVFGTKSERRDATPLGSFYQYSFAHGLRRLALPEATIPNSICFSRDGRTLYFCDSVRPEIFCCDYEPRAAGVSRIRPFVHIDLDGASPDGSCVDAEGHLWNAQWGEARVVRYSPDGAIGDIVTLPAKNPSCCAFAGPRLDRLYITTAREEMSDAELEAMPQAGALFGVDLAPLRGLPESRFTTQ